LPTVFVQAVVLVSVGELIDLAAHRADRSRRSYGGRIAFFFDLACPFSYLTAERVERTLGHVSWVPVAPMESRPIRALVAAEYQAMTLRLPLVWPDSWPDPFPSAMRAAAHAASSARAGQFALAASRLAFCGGFDLEDAEILTDAAAAAGLAPGELLAATTDASWDVELEATADGLARRGVRELPAIRVGSYWRAGQRALAEAAALVRAGALDAALGGA
jgi:2-hydroxychromene-2-carboxylate isomerase